MMLKLVPYSTEILAGLVCLLLIGAGVQTVRLDMCQSALKLEKAEHVNDVNMLELSRSTVVDLRAKIVTQNEVIRKAAEAGVAAQAELDAMSRTAAELALAREKLSSLTLEHAELKKQAENLTTCETYELVLRSIAGSLP